MRHEKATERVGFSIDVPSHFGWGGLVGACALAAVIAIAYVLLTSTNGLRIAFDVSKIHERHFEPTVTGIPNPLTPVQAAEKPPGAVTVARHEPPIEVKDDDLVAPDPHGNARIVFNPYPTPSPWTLRPVGKPRFIDGGNNYAKALKPFPIDARIVNNMPELVFIPYGLNGPSFELCWDIPGQFQQAGLNKTCVTYSNPRPLK
jgi:hypothetical protein